ncbi:PEP-CTERM sorting domain-containing protein [Roseateles albus]|uniref:PEP-CTERM sorting domain-containing protein n=1 Tax=Roseateles albus TaxID=2987525 RepID=A0ABT5KCY6_9BURK|nr:PEP-CTERM sorting domain-containing protein [Roseateles albus]MDC8771791.1 PEP-CTERM sorting domain-containing protein [Roseateles albus]
MIKTVALSALSLGLLLAGAAQAASTPTATGMKNGTSFAEFTGTDPLAAEKDKTLYWVYEGSVLGGKDSWFLFFDPKNSGSIKATVDFHATITDLFQSKSELLNSESSLIGAPHYGKKYPDAVGLESGDKKNTSFSGSQLSLNWSASNPGDHVRVFTAAVTAVPEPSSYAMLMAGLLAMGFVARRHRAS